MFTVATSAQTPDEEDVVKITSKLVQLDVVVTDAKGNQVTGLTSADFTVLQDGKPQTISGFSYVPMGGSGAAAQPQPVERSTKGQPTAPLTRSKPGARGRIITFVIDDGNCRASTEGMRASREALEKFITEQMLPGDVAAIFQTRSGSSMFQQYTSDRAQLMRAARKIRWYPPSGGCAANDGTFYDAARVSTETITTPDGLKSIAAESEDERKRRELSEDRAKDHQVVGSLGVLRYAIRGLERVPGRKVLFFLSDGIPLRARDGRALRAVDQLRDLTDQANRAAVVLNTVDVRGVFDTSMIEARDEVSVLGNPRATDELSGLRRDAITNSQDGLKFLADETGGTLFKNENYLDAPLRRGLEVEKGYYLLAYEPEDETFKGKNFNRIEIRVNRPELRVISRAGFLGVVDQTSERKKTGDSELYEAIVAPLPTSGMNLRLTASGGSSKASGTFVRADIHIPGQDVSFVDSNGLKKAVFDVVAVTMNEKNEVVDEFTHTHTVSVPVTALATIEQNGLVYSADVKVMKSGSYNFRVALRDTNSGRLGSVSQVVEVPEMKAGRIFVSGLTVTAVDANGKFEAPEAPKKDAPFTLPKSPSSRAIRVFSRGSVIAYPYTVYNARLGADGRPKLNVQVNLYYEGKRLLEGKPTPADLAQQEDWSRINDYGLLKLNPNLKPGDYLLEVVVTDLSASGKKAVSSQHVDFEVVQ